MTNPTPAPFGAKERAVVTGELLDEVIDLLNEYSRMAQLTVVEVLGVLELAKAAIIEDQAEPYFDEDDDNES